MGWDSAGCRLRLVDVFGLDMFSVSLMSDARLDLLLCFMSANDIFSFRIAVYICLTKYNSIITYILQLSTFRQEDVQSSEGS